jgi:tetratricopeptide (TPR) repeat protein
MFQTCCKGSVSRIRRYRVSFMKYLLLVIESAFAEPGSARKSQLAVQYSHNVRDTNPQTFIFWVHTSTRARFEEGYRNIAEKLKLPGVDDPKANILQIVTDWLCDETNGQWLMILDNVDDIDVLYRTERSDMDDSSTAATTPLATYIPQSRNGSILITSRSKDAAARLTGGYRNIMEVNAMDTSQGLQLLRNKLVNDAETDNEIANTLLDELGHIPLAIIQATAYINRRAPRMTIASYLDEFKRNDKKKESLLNWNAEDLRRDMSASNSVVTTWQMSFERLRETRQSAADLLSLMSFFNPQGIPEPVLRSYLREVRGTDEDDIEFEDDLYELQCYSLVSVTADINVCEMHPLAQFCTRVWLKSAEMTETWRNCFLDLMAFEYPTGEYENWSKCQVLLPHIELLHEQKPEDEEARKNWARVLSNSSWYLWMKGSYNKALESAEIAVKTREEIFGEYDINTLESITVLSVILQDLGLFKRAEEMNRKVLEGRERALGKDHAFTLVTVNNIALVLRDQGKNEEAEVFARRAVEGRGRIYGDKHPETLMSMNNLVSVLWNLDKQDEAEAIGRQALKDSQHALGMDHPNTLAGVNNLALVLRSQQKYNEAEEMNRRAVEGYEKSLGKNHHFTLRGLTNLALILRDKGNLEEAEQLNRRALDAYERELGKDHPSTINALHCLAFLLDQLGQYETALELYQSACDGFMKVLGPDHPNTIACLSDLKGLKEYLEPTKPVEETV